MAEVQDIFVRYGNSFLEKHVLSPQQMKAFRAISACRSSALGGHAEVCPECGEVSVSYNSCKNRHCPKCQAFRREVWVEKRSRDLLDVGYYHAVFTVPSELYALFYRNQRLCYALLFHASWETVKAFAKDPRYLGATPGATSVLHTWGRRLQYHPHVHMIIPSGGLSANKLWKSSGKNFFAPVKAMSKVFRAKLLSGLGKMREDLRFPGATESLSDEGEFSHLITSLYKRDWVVYCKKPFRDAGCVLSYLGRYTHRVAISNSRIESCEDGIVRFSYRDAQDGNRLKTCTLSADEFIRRFLMHVLPKGFAKIRHFGILASRDKSARMALCRRLTRTPSPMREEPDPVAIITRMIGHAPGICSHCRCKLVAVPLRC